MPNTILASLLENMGISYVSADRPQIVGTDPVFDSPFRVSEAAAAVLAGQGLLIDHIWQQRGHGPQDIKVEVMAAGLSTIGVAYQSQHGYPLPIPDPVYPTVGFYPTRDDRQILLHGGYPLLRDGTLELLGCADSAPAIANAVMKWNAFDLEEALAAHGLTGAVARTHDEWLAHPQGEAVAATPVIQIVKIADSKPEPFAKDAARPLSGLKVLDFTHVIAGPTCAKSLASFGAEVLHIFCPTRARLLPFDIDTGHGKLSALLDLKNPNDNRTARNLMKQADVFSQSYRPGKLAGMGFSPQSIAELRPGAIVVSTSCYGHEGPWHYRPGFEQLAQTATGMAAAQGALDNPQLAPTYPNDYLTGYLGALGTLAALILRAEQGGSYHVKVSLARSATWLQSLGKVDRGAYVPGTVTPEYLNSYMCKEVGPLGVLDYFGFPLQMSETKPFYERPAVPLGMNFPVWAADQAAAQAAAMGLTSTTK